ncbi:hypothetical protein TNIN_121631, partial [Trichonephila inaurata madagascariensis]
MQAAFRHDQEVFDLDEMKEENGARERGGDRVCKQHSVIPK